MIKILVELAHVDEKQYISFFFLDRSMCIVHNTLPPRSTSVYRLQVRVVPAILLGQDRSVFFFNNEAVNIVNMVKGNSHPFTSHIVGN